MKINMDFTNSIDLIEGNYPGQNPRQMPIYLEIDWENEEISARTRNYQIDGTPARQWHGLVSVYQLPNDTNALELIDWVKNEILPRAEKIADGFSSEWDGHNWVGTFTEDAREEEEGITRDLECGSVNESIPRLMDGGGLWDMREWVRESDFLNEITPETTDKELGEIKSEIISVSDVSDIVLDYDGTIMDFLKEYRDDL
jgi:hypothetical protein